MIHMPKKTVNETICSLQSSNELVGMFGFMTVKEVSEVLKVSRDTVYRLLDSRDLPFHMIGGCKRILLTDLKQYLAKTRIQAHNEQ